MTDMGTMLTQAQDYARSYITRILRKYPDDVDDVMQEAARKALRGIGRFRGESQFKSWFTRIVINEALMRLRYASTHDARAVSMSELSSLGSARLDEGDSYSPRWEPPSADPSPEEIAVANELQQAIDSEAATWGRVLKEELRLMLLGVGAGLDNTRKARRFRVRNRLRKVLTEKGLL